MSDDSTNSIFQPVLPPLSIRGVTELLSSWPDKPVMSIDWLRYSVPWPDGSVPEVGRNEILRRALHPSPLLSLTGEFLPVPKGYDTCLGVTHGSLRFHSERASQKIGVEFTGRDLSELRVEGLAAVDLMTWAIRNGARVTRLDLALDVFGQDANPLDLYKAFLAGELVTAAREVGPHNRQVRDGDQFRDKDRGVYIGSRSSERFMRVYDKALEQSVEGVKWTRIELQLGGDVANVMAACMSAGNWMTVAKAAIRGFCEAPTVSWYQNALDGPEVELPVLPRRNSDRKRWLLEQVLPALRSELVACELHDDWELYAAFQTALEMYRHREGKRG